MNREGNVYLIGAAVCFTIAGLIGAAHAAHPAADQQLHDTFYRDWMMPDKPNVSCCNEEDCAPVSQVRQGDDGRWQARRESDGVWLTIPTEKVELNRDSPDGRSHMCSAGKNVYCFVLGIGS